MKKSLQCGQISIEEFGFLKRNFYVKTRAGFMETLYGKVSAPNAGERDHVQLEPQDKTQDQPVMVLLSPSPNLRRRKMLRKAAESALLGDSSGVPRLLPQNL